MERAAPEGETSVFGDESKAVSPVPTVDLKTLHAKIGELTLMKEMGIEAIYRQPNASKPAVERKIYPYLLRKLAVISSNQVWAIGPTPYLLPVMHDGHGCTEK